MLRRDDDSPAPWTDAGKKMIEELGIQDMVVPDGYHEMMEEKRRKEELEKGGPKKTRKKSLGGDDNEAGGSTGKSAKKRRRISSSDEEEDDGAGSDGSEKENAGGGAAAAKKARKSAPLSSSAVVAFEPPKAVAEAIAADLINAKLWAEAKEAGAKGRPKFIAKMQELFNCVCCQEVVADPVTTPCGHNSCQACLKRSFSSDVKNCPVCRGELTDADWKKVNANLATVLKTLLPGYELGR